MRYRGLYPARALAFALTRKIYKLNQKRNFQPAQPINGEGDYIGKAEIVQRQIKPTIAY